MRYKAEYKVEAERDKESYKKSGDKAIFQNEENCLLYYRNILAMGQARTPEIRQ